MVCCVLLDNVFEFVEWDVCVFWFDCEIVLVVMDLWVMFAFGGFVWDVVLVVVCWVGWIVL